MGLPWLTPWEEMKVKSANKIYGAIARFMYECDEWKIPFTVENPRGSYIWSFPDVRRAMEDIETYNVDFQACMYGAKRDKWTRLVTNEKHFTKLAVKCDGSHEHEPWGQVWADGKWQWATKLECEYSEGLCEAMAKTATEVTSQGELPTPKPRITRRVATSDPHLTQVRAAAGKQTRKDHDTNVPERKEPTWITLHALKATALIPGPLKEDQVIGDTTLRKGSLIESVTQRKLGRRGSDRWEIRVQIREPWTTEEFIKESTKVKVPWRRQAFVPDRTLKLVVEALEKGVEEFDRKWEANIEILARRAANYKEQEEVARKNLKAWVKKVSQGKQTILMEDLLRTIKYPDIDVARCVREGFPLAGDMPETGVFKKKEEHEIEFGADPEWLESMAEDLREDLVQSLLQGETSEVDKAVYELTCGEAKDGNEVEKGWAEGPYTEEQITNLLGTDRWVASRRFGVKQGEKIRQIDDFSKYFINGCTTVEERIDLDGVDHVVNLSRIWMELIEMAKKDGGWFQVEWENGRKS